VIVADYDVGRAHNQNSFVQGVLDRESGSDHTVETGIVEAVHEDAVRKAGGVDNGFVGSHAYLTTGLDR